VKRTLVAGAAAAILAAGYLVGLMATGLALFTIGFVGPPGAGPPPARTAVYSATASAIRGPLFAPRAALPAAPAPPEVARTLAVNAGSTAVKVAEVVSTVQSATECASARSDHLAGCAHGAGGQALARQPVR
jgi:hypothetical protein